MTERTWVVNGKQVTLAQFRAEIEARKTVAAPIMAAFRKGDEVAFKSAQKTFRAKFGG